MRDIMWEILQDVVGRISYREKIGVETVECEGIADLKHDIHGETAACILEGDAECVRAEVCVVVSGWVP